MEAESPRSFMVGGEVLEEQKEMVEAAELNKGTRFNNQGGLR